MSPDVGFDLPVDAEIIRAYLYTYTISQAGNEAPDRTRMLVLEAILRLAAGRKEAA